MVPRGALWYRTKVQFRIGAHRLHFLEVWLKRPQVLFTYMKGDRTMKTLRWTFLFLLALGAGRADAQENLIALLQSDVRAEAQQIMTFAMQLSNDEAANFWPVYREYELDRANWGDRRIALIRTFAGQFDILTDSQAEDLAEEMFDLLDDRLDLYKKFYEKFADDVSPSVGARFVQVARQIDMIIDLQIAQEMPLVFRAAGR